MTGTSLFATTTETDQKFAEPSSFMAFDHQRIATDQQQPVVARSPASKKIKLSTTFNSPIPPEVTTQPQQPPNDSPDDVKMGGTVDDKGVQTTIPVADSSASQVGVRNSSAPGTFFQLHSYSRRCSVRNMGVSTTDRPFTGTLEAVVLPC